MSAPADVFRRHRLTIGDYHRIGDAGVFASDARVELIEGEIIDMAPIGSRHAGTVDRLMQLLVLAVGEAAIVRCRNPIVLDDYNEPQPDLCLLRARADFYRLSHPRPADVWLIVEVAETTLAYDRDIKLPLYARAGIPEVWIVDVAVPALHIRRMPEGDRYAEVAETVVPGKVSPTVSLAALPEVSVDLSRLWVAS